MDNNENTKENYDGSREQLYKLSTVILAIALVVSIFFGIPLRKPTEIFNTMTDYFGSPEQLYNVYAGILDNNIRIVGGTDFKLSYDFNHPDYQELKDKYNLVEIAGEGSEFERSVRLMNEFGPRLEHKSNYRNNIRCEALPLLEYSLDKSSGINCRAKAQILNEMCLSLGMYSRKATIESYSKYDTECHVVNEIWDSELGKWVMLDITASQYWINRDGIPLSIIELRNLMAVKGVFAPVNIGDDLSGISVSKVKEMQQQNFDRVIYMAKNLVYISYGVKQSVGEYKGAYGLDIGDKRLQANISLEAINASPF